MMWTKNIQHLFKSEEVNYKYNNIPIYCAKGVHEKVGELLKQKLLDKNSSILILGAGAGALDERIFDLGYKNITAVEFRKEIYKSRGKILERDLNSDFYDLGKFDCVIAIEIIEHLENHFHFMRNIDSITNKGGLVFVSSPNIHNALSRFKFFMKGDLDFFNREEINKTGHINPLFSDIILFYTENNTNLKLINTYTNSSVWKMDMYPNIKIKTIIFFTRLITLFIKRREDSQILILSFVKE